PGAGGPRSTASRRASYPADGPGVRVWTGRVATAWNFLTTPRRLLPPRLHRDKIRIHAGADYRRGNGARTMDFASLWGWLLRRPVQRPDLCFLLYTRANCPLCDEAWEILARYQKRHGFKLESKDVDGSEALVCGFGNCVPVVMVNSKVRFRGHVNEVLLQR